MGKKAQQQSEKGNKQPSERRRIHKSRQHFTFHMCIGFLLPWVLCWPKGKRFALPNPKKSQKQNRGSKGEIYEGRGDGADWQRALRLSLMRKVVNRLSRKSYFMAQSYCSHKNVGLCEEPAEYGVRGKFSGLISFNSFRFDIFIVLFAGQIFRLVRWYFWDNRNHMSFI